MPDAAKLALTAVLALTLAGVLVAPAPRRCRSREAVALGAVGCVFYLAAGALALAGRNVIATLLVCAGIAILAGAGWLARGMDDHWRRDDDGDDDLDPVGPVDWDEFDHLRAGWDRPRVLA